jgi:putative Mn2+ efflux pump MntP
VAPKTLCELPESSLLFLFLSWGCPQNLSFLTRIDAYLAFKLLVFLGSVCLGGFLDTFPRLTRFSRRRQEVESNFLEPTALVLFERRQRLTCIQAFLV